jgi:hypothetical protein
VSWSGFAPAHTSITWGDDFTLSSIDTTIFGRPPASSIANQVEPEPGRTVATASRVIPPTPQTAQPHRLTVRADDPPTELGSITSKSQHSFNPPPVSTPRRAFISVPFDIPPDNGMVIFRRSQPQMLPQFRPPPVAIARREDPTEAGAVLGRPALPGFPRTDLARPQRQAMREELAPGAGSAVASHNPNYPTPLRPAPARAYNEQVPFTGDPGLVITSSGAKFVNLRTPPSVVAAVEALAPYAGGIVYHAGPPAAVHATSQPPRGTIAQAEALPAFPGSAVWAHGDGITTPTAKPPQPVIARGDDPPPHAGQSVGPRAPRAYDVRPGRSTITTTEVPTEPGRAFFDVNPIAITVVRPRPVIVARADQVDGGASFQHHGGTVSTPPFARPTRPVIASGIDNPSDPGKTMTWHAGPPPANESYAMVDPDLATLIIVTSGASNQVDPDLASEVIAE